MKINHFTPKQIAGWTAFGRHYIRDMVYAANDGIVTTFAVVAGRRVPNPVPASSWCSGLPISPRTGSRWPSGITSVSNRNERQFSATPTRSGPRRSTPAPRRGDLDFVRHRRVDAANPILRQPARSSRVLVFAGADRDGAVRGGAQAAQLSPGDRHPVADWKCSSSAPWPVSAAFLAGWLMEGLIAKS